MTTIGRTWNLWAVKRVEAERMPDHLRVTMFFHVGQRAWVELHGSREPIVPVLVEEILGDPYAPEVTNYGWEDLARPRPGDEDEPRIPRMVQIRSTSTPEDPKRALLLLNMCFPYGIDAEVEHGSGRVLALRITERDV